MTLDLDFNDGDGDDGNFYDCNICLKMAKEPIVTCCGHLFCWECFYNVDYANPCARECPVCKGQVFDAGITPIYGNANEDHVVSEVESGSRIPPRPMARRVESVRQQSLNPRQPSLNPRVSTIPVAHVFRRIRLDIGAMLEPTRQNNVDSANGGSENIMLVLLPNTEAGDNERPHSDQVSRTSPESDYSFSSISSAVDVGHINEFEDFYANLLQEPEMQLVPVNDADSSSNVAIIQTELQNVDSTAETNFAVTSTSASGVPDTSTADTPMESPVFDSSDSVSSQETRRARRRLR